MKEVDLIVIGAGPAGMAAARTAADGGGAVLLLDEQPEPGGQIYRGVLRADNRRSEILGENFLAGRPLAEALDHRKIRVEKGAVVWRVERSGHVAWTRSGAARIASGRRVLVATGAIERPVPIRGWTLPGVMTAGAAQILLKTAGMVPKNAVLAGSGPLLYLLAQQLIAAGAPPKAVVETQNLRAHLRASRHLPRALWDWQHLLKGARMLAAIRRAGVPRHTGATKLRATGVDAVEGLRFRAAGQTREIPCDTLLLHQGIVPNVQITRSLGLAHDWDPAQRCWHPRHDIWGSTDVPAIMVAGDGGGIAGAGAAVLTGKLAALEALHALGRLSETGRDAQAATLRRALKRELAARRFLNTLYAPAPEIIAPPDDVVICRCEEITAGMLRGYVQLGCLGPNQTKAFSRCGMGPCQGRYCGLTVAELLARERDVSPETIGYYRIRAPLKPVTLGELAQLADGAT
ncbi:MAG: FAD-dependent oxidoreductase [Rhodospirillales bacterium]|nr:MAG: FAD-dependent oxidoreductase [Rhodospirillales bacterium]